jgi:hypothetical protein
VVTRLAIAILTVAAVGVGMAFFAVAGITLLQRAVPDSLLARILAVRESAMLTGLAAGAALAPVLVRTVGAAQGYAVLGGILGLLALAALPALRGLDAVAVFRPQLVSLMRGVPFLALLDVQALERLAHAATELQLPGRHTVFRQGDAGDAYYLVDAGQLAVSVAGHRDEVRLGAGEGFGDVALLRDVRRTAPVRTINDVRLWRFDRQVFLDTVAGSAGQDVAERHIDSRLDRWAPLPPPADQR